MTYPDNIEEIKKFAKKIKLNVKYLLGEKYEGYMNLYFVLYLPKNIIFNVDGDLYLDSVESLPDNIKFNVGKNLCLDSVQSLPSNTIFNVNGKIYFPTNHKVKVIW
jgi:hypothetical protein